MLITFLPANEDTLPLEIARVNTTRKEPYSVRVVDSFGFLNRWEDFGPAIEIRRCLEHQLLDPVGPL